VRLLLASKSLARRRMLEAAGVKFEGIGVNFDEDGVKASLRGRGLAADELALALAGEKALAGEAGPGDLVLGSDQTLELDDSTMLDKPSSPAELLDQLQRLSGRIHKLHAAAAIVEDRATVWTHIETVAMHVRPLGADFLHNYVDAEFDTVRWSVGGYHFEGRGAQLFERVEGSHFAVQGLPLLPLLEYLRKRGVIPA
jgi:septum formation protein